MRASDIMQRSRQMKCYHLHEGGDWLLWGSGGGFGGGGGSIDIDRDYCWAVAGVGQICICAGGYAVSA